MLGLLSLCLLQTRIERVPLQDNPQFQDLGAYWTKQMPVYGITGFAIGAVKDGEVVLLDGIGVTDPSSGRKVDIDTRYYIASITKTMTAMAIEQLAEQGKIDLDAPVRHYLPRFTLADAEYAQTITIRDLLSHKKGISSRDVVLLDAFTGDITEDRYYTLLAKSEPTKKVTYSNVDFTLLGRVIEAVNRKSWKDYLSENIFEPMGMDRTTAKLASCYGDADWAPPLSSGSNGPEFVTTMKTDRSMHAAGGVVSTARDMMKFVLEQLNGGIIDGHRFLKESTVEDAFKHQSTYDRDGSIRRMDGYGYAWNVGAYRDIPGFAAHGGNYSGYSTYVAMVPSKRTAVIVLVNNGEAGNAFMTVVAVDVLDRLLGYPIDDRVRTAYATQVTKMREARAQVTPIGPNPAVSGLLSRQPSAYVGSYKNPLYGSISIRLSGGILKCDWGDMPMNLKATSSDGFDAYQDFQEQPIPGKFVFDGRVSAIELKFNSKTLYFTRK